MAPVKSPSRRAVYIFPALAFLLTAVADDRSGFLLNVAIGQRHCQHARNFLSISVRASSVIALRSADLERQVDHHDIRVFKRRDADRGDVFSGAMRAQMLMPLRPMAPEDAMR